MNIHIKLTGKVEEILNALLEKGYATDKSEAIRIALLHYNEHFKITEEKMTEEDKKELKDALKEYREGKTINFNKIREE